MSKDKAKTSAVTWFVFWLFVVLIVVMCSRGNDTGGTNSRESDIAAQFMPHSGEHVVLSYVLKKKLRDPDSYQHIETRYMDRETFLVVWMKYRAKNGFGGYVVNAIAAHTDIKGNILKIVDADSINTNLLTPTKGKF